MPACTALGVKSSSSDASAFGRSSLPPPLLPQPARASTHTIAISLATAGHDGGPRYRPRLMRRRVTFSRNLTLSLSRTCRCHCKYCAFATHQTHLHEPEEVERLIDRAARRRVKELLVLTGEAPDHHAGVRARLAELGFDSFTAYVVWACERALERGLLPHT